MVVVAGDRVYTSAIRGTTLHAVHPCGFALNIACNAAHTRLRGLVTSLRTVLSGDPCAGGNAGVIQLADFNSSDVGVLVSTCLAAGICTAFLRRRGSLGLGVVSIVRTSNISFTFPSADICVRGG